MKYKDFIYEISSDNTITITEYKGVNTNVVIPTEIDGRKVTEIGDGAFDSCNRLVNVHLPDSLTKIGRYAFADCNNLVNVHIPDSLTEIGRRAFSGCICLQTKPGKYRAFLLENNCLVSEKFQTVFTENEWSKEIEEIEPCQSGYHFCTNLFEIFNYYSGRIDKDIAIYECEVDRVIQTATSKCVTNKIKPVRRLYREDVINILNGNNRVNKFV